MEASNPGIVLNPIQLTDSADLSNELRHKSNASKHTSRAEVPFSIPITKGTWHFTKGLTALFKICAAILALYVVGAKQSVDSLLSLTRTKENGIGISRCTKSATAAAAGIDLTYCQTSGTPLGAVCRDVGGACKLPVANNFTTCMASASAGSLPLLGNSTLPCYSVNESTVGDDGWYDRLGTCCCDGTLGGSQGMFLNTDTGECVPFASSERELELLFKYVFAAAFPLIVAALLWAGMLITIFKQDLYYRLLQHGFLLDFKDRGMRGKQYCGWRYVILYVIPLGMAYYIFYSIKGAGAQSTADLIEHTLLTQIGWIAVLLMYYSEVLEQETSLVTINESAFSSRSAFVALPLVAHN
jgi:hypothetical protein